MERNVRTGGTDGGAKIVGKGKKSVFDEHTGPGPRIMAADTLEGDEVRNQAGDDLGKIEHIMLDVPTGRIAYAVLSFGGVFGMGDKLFAVPWRALILDTDNKCFILNASKEQLKDAPGFDKDHWPTFADQRWGRDIHSYYGFTPYWDEF
jgi:sporulation protein YlmC with PRC-barrel domain